MTVASWTADKLIVAPNHAETPLRVLLILVSIALWAVIAVSLIGIFYTLFLLIFFFFAHLAFITYIRGSAVRLNEQQMPELYARVIRHAERLGLRKIPKVYLQQSGGVLNAFATKFFGSDFIVLYADLIAACEGNEAALDFIIGHELGHLHRPHLRRRWLILPGLFIPFLGSAYSRACELTCDQYGAAIAGDQQRALDGLILLAAGPEHAKRVDRKSFVGQLQDLNNAWMQLGQWLAGYPPLARRVARLDPALAVATGSTVAAKTGALAIILGLAMIPVAAFWLVLVGLPKFHNMMQYHTILDEPAATMAEPAMPEVTFPAETGEAAESNPPMNPRE